MQPTQMDNVGALPLASAIGFFVGTIGIVLLFIQQSLTVFLPLLLPLVVCSVLCTVLYKIQNAEAKSDTPKVNPVRFDVI
jgi:uncharacterized membrane protein YqgA involved in biofilm formation